MKKYLLSLDESGCFDPLDTKRSHITGFVFRPYDEWSWQEEKSKLISYLKNKCAETGLSRAHICQFYFSRRDMRADFTTRELIKDAIFYLEDNESAWQLPENICEEIRRKNEFSSKFPQAGFPGCLHTTFDDAETKKILIEMIKEYIREQNSAHPGTYQLFSLVTDEINKDNSPIVDDRLGANLYNHMLTAVLNNAIFTNPFLPKEDRYFRLELPTRKHVIKRNPADAASIAESTERIKELETLGMVPFSIEPGRIKFDYPDWKVRLNDPRIRWTTLYYDLPQLPALQEALRTQLYEHPDTAIAANDIAIQTIDYFAEDQTAYANLYLADILCAYLTGILLEQKGISSMIQTIEKELGTPPLILRYQEDSRVLIAAEAAISNGRMDDYLAIRFSDNRTKEQLFYLNQLETAVLERFSARQLEQMYLREELLFLESNYTRAGKELTWIYQKAMEKHAFSTIPKLHFRYANLLMRLSQHMSDPKSIEYEEICNQLECAITPDDKIQQQIQTISSLENVFCFEKALKESQNVSRLCSKIYKAHKQKYDLNYAKAVGKVAQNKAFSQKRADSEFELALNLISPEDPVNLNISLSYLLHYCIESGNEKKFWLYAVEYFGQTNAEQKQEKFLDWLSRYGDVTNGANRFALFVLVKAYWYFYGKQLPDPQWDEFATALVDLQISDAPHPNELIMKYQALIACGLQRNVRALEIFEHLQKKANQQTQALFMIYHSILLELALALNMSAAEVEQIIVCMQNYLQSDPLLLMGMGKIAKTKDPKQVLSAFTYMYR